MSLAAIDLVNIAADTGGFVIHGQDVGDRSGFSVASAGDIDGDGFDDLIIGARDADAASNLKTFAGGSYVIFGRDFTSTVTHAGDGAANSLTGTAGADVMVGGGGADAMSGGEGNDLLVVSDLNFRRIDGGTGTDTLRLGASMTLRRGSGQRAWPSRSAKRDVLRFFPPLHSFRYCRDPGATAH